MRAMGGGSFRPPCMRGMARARVASQRQRTWNMGDCSAAWASTSSRLAVETKEKIESSGKLCCGPRESSTPSSVAAACSSKSKVRQKRLRSASPKARFRRAPKGAWSTSCIPPASSKKRSATSVSWVGSAPSAARPAARYSTACRAPASGMAPSEASQAMAASRSPSRASISARSRDTSCESSALRPGASPFQKGTPGGAPCASSTRTTPASMRRMRQEALPRRNTSPARLSTAKSSSTCPTCTPSGSATTAYWALSGMAPPPVRAARRAPRRPAIRWWTASRCSSAPARPRRVAMPSESIPTTWSKAARGRSR